MEKENKKLTKEEQIKIIDDLIEGNKKVQEDINKAIKELGDNVPPHVLQDLGYMYGNTVDKQATLERMKDGILNQGLGNEYAEKAFGIY